MLKIIAIIFCRRNNDIKQPFKKVVVMFLAFIEKSEILSIIGAVAT